MVVAPDHTQSSFLAPLEKSAKEYSWFSADENLAGRTLDQLRDPLEAWRVDCRPSLLRWPSRSRCQSVPRFQRTQSSSWPEVDIVHLRCNFGNWFNEVHNTSVVLWPSANNLVQEWDLSGHATKVVPTSLRLDGTILLRNGSV